MKRFRLRLSAKKPGNREREIEPWSPEEGKEQNADEIDTGSCCPTTQPSEIGHNEVRRRGSMAIYDVASLRTLHGPGLPGARDKSSLSQLMRSTLESQLGDEMRAARCSIRDQIDAELHRQRDQALIEQVIRDGEISLARYEHNSSETSLLLGMKRYEKSRAEYERSVTIVRQLSDLEKRVRRASNYHDAQRLLEGYQDEVQRILGISVDFQESGSREQSLLEELASGRVQDYVASLIDRQARRQTRP
jgi:hypothetical protein